MRASEGEVTALYAVIAEGEGIVALVGEHGPMPMVTYVERVAARWLGEIDELANQCGSRLYLVKAIDVYELAVAEPSERAIR